MWNRVPAPDGNGLLKTKGSSVRVKWVRVAVCASLLGLSVAASAQEITADEMIMLERLRAEMTTKGVTVTPEMEVRMLQRIRAMRPLTEPGAAMSAPAPPAAPAATSPSASMAEADLLRRLQALDPAQPIRDLKLLRDGLMVDGQRFADSEGRATRVAVDTTTGRLGYAVDGAGPGTGLVKIARADRPGEAVTIGQFTRNGNTLQMTTVTGKTMTGEMFFPLVDGALVMRDSVAFRYRAGIGVEQVSLPAGWFPTPIQRGNVGTTGWILLEKDVPEAKSSPLAALSSLGKLVGAMDANEYALFEMKTGRLVEINQAADGKNTYSYSQCRRKNGIVNICDRMTSYESAFQPDGRPNVKHYLWNIDWHRTTEGPVLVAAEGTLNSKLVGVHLDSGKKVVLYERALGVTLGESRIGPDGKMSMSVQLGLGSEAMDDVAAQIKARPAVSKTADASAR